MPVTRRCAVAGRPRCRRSLGDRHRPRRAPPGARRLGRPVGGGGPLARFLESLQARGLRGVEYVVSDDHAGLQAARRAVLGRRNGSAASSTWPRTPSITRRVSRSASASGPSCARSGTLVPLAKAETALAELVSAYRDTARNLPHGWENVPEGLAVFALPEHHRRRMRTSNPMERGVQQELKRRTVKVRVFPNEDALESDSSAPCWSRSTTNGPPTPRPTSNGNARMRDHARR
jgi:hypothetical protein